MKTLLFIISLFACTAAHSDMNSLLSNFKKHNDKVMDLKKSPEKYGLAPKGLNEIKYASLHLEIATMQLSCNTKNRKVCSNQIAQNGSK